MVAGVLSAGGLTAVVSKLMNGANCYRPKALQPAYERMQPETRQVHIPYGTSSIEPRKDIAQPLDVVREHTPRHVILIRPL
jgi:hypothetical protein